MGKYAALTAIGTFTILNPKKAMANSVPPPYASSPGPPYPTPPPLPALALAPYTQGATTCTRRTYYSLGTEGKGERYDTRARARARTHTPTHTRTQLLRTPRAEHTRKLLPSRCGRLLVAAARCEARESISPAILTPQGRIR